MAEVIKIVDPGEGDGHDYHSLSLWEAGEAKDLVTATEQATAKCRATGGTADTTAVSMSGAWTTSATYFIKIWTDPAESHRHPGYWDDAKYRLSTTANASTLSSTGTAQHLYIYGLQIQVSESSASSKAIGFYPSSAGTLTAAQNIVRRVKVNSRADKYGMYIRNADTYIYDNIIYGFPDLTNYGIYYYNSGTNYCYSNTFIGCTTGLVEGGTSTLTDNLAFGCADCYAGTWNAGSNNAYTEGSDPRTGGIDLSAHLATPEDIFVDYANHDFHLKAGAVHVLDAGIDLSATFTVDIDNATRPTGAGTWDIGADEIATIAPITITMGVATCTATAPSSDVTPGAVSIAMGAAVAAASAVTAVLTAGVISLSMAAASCAASAPSAVLTPGAVSMTMGAAASSATAPTLTITPDAVILTMGVASAVATAPTCSAAVEPLRESRSDYPIAADSGWIELSEGLYYPRFGGSFAQSGYTLYGVLDTEHRGFLSFDVTGLPITEIKSAVLTLNLIGYTGSPTVWKLKIDAIDYDPSILTQVALAADWNATAKLSKTIGPLGPPPPTGIAIDWGSVHGGSLNDLFNAGQTRVGFRITDQSTITDDFLTKPPVALATLEFTYTVTGVIHANPATAVAVAPILKLYRVGQIVTLAGGRGTSATRTSAPAAVSLVGGGARARSTRLTSGRRI